MAQKNFSKQSLFCEQQEACASNTKPLQRVRRRRRRSIQQKFQGNFTKLKISRARWSGANNELLFAGGNISDGQKGEEGTEDYVLTLERNATSAITVDLYESIGNGHWKRLPEDIYHMINASIAMCSWYKSMWSRFN